MNKHMNKHTPGPWHSYGNGHRGLRVICDHGHLVCEIDRLREEDKANAKLIASAPDMLEELRKLRADVATLAAGVQAASEQIEKFLILDGNATQGMSTGEILDATIDFLNARIDAEAVAAKYEETGK